MVAGNKPRGAGAHAIVLDRGRGGHLERRMVAEVEIIVAGEGEEAATVADDPWAFLAKTLGNRAPQRCALKLRQFGLSEIIQGPHRHLALFGVALAATAPVDRPPHRLDLYYRPPLRPR